MLIDHALLLVYTIVAMKADIYLKLQKKFGGQWVATSESGRKVYGAAKKVKDLFAQLEKKHIHPKKTAIGYIQKSGQVSVYVSLSVQKH